MKICVASQFPLFVSSEKRVTLRSKSERIMLFLSENYIIYRSANFTCFLMKWLQHPVIVVPRLRILICLSPVDSNWPKIYLLHPGWS